MERVVLQSDYDGLNLEISIIEPDTPAIGIVQFSHGMAEHKERYEDFMHYLSKKGFICVINDHRGHGASIKNKKDLGFFYTDSCDGIISDLHQITQYCKNRFPNLPVYLFSHSMGTLVARNYIKKYDDEIEKLVLSGPPTRNGAIGFAIFLTKISTLLHGKRYRNKFINYLAIGNYNKKEKIENAWLCKKRDTVKKYNKDELCGYCFTNNGFRNLFLLHKGAYSTHGWMMKNPKLPIFIVAGEKDPVIQGKKKYMHLISFLKKKGYQNVSAKLYKDCRHEILNEENNHMVYEDVYFFLKNGTCKKK